MRAGATRTALLGLNARLGALPRVNCSTGAAPAGCGPTPRQRTAMKKNWLVVANASRARVLEKQGTEGPLLHVADLVHPESRQKGSELGDDRPGRVDRIGSGLNSSAYPPHTDPRHREHERFAREVAKLLSDGVAADRCGGLLLVASNPFLGELKSHLSDQATKAIVRTVPSDYTLLRDSELEERLHPLP